MKHTQYPFVWLYRFFGLLVFPITRSALCSTPIQRQENLETVPIYRPPPPIDPTGRTGWQQFVSVVVSQPCSAKSPLIKLCYWGCRSISRKRTSITTHPVTPLRTFIDCNCFSPFCINSWISLGSCTFLCSLNASLVLRLAYSLKLYDANCSPCRSNWRY